MTHPNRLRLSRLSLGLLVALAAAPVFAQSTSAGLGGTVVGADGQPVAGAEVTITHVESGSVSRATTDASGRYNARGLRVGGPYTIAVTKAGAGADTEENVFLSLNQVATVNAQLATGGTTTLQTVTIMGTVSSVFSTDNKGVGTSVDGRELEIMPQGSRSVDDIARLDPRVTVIDQAGGSISVAGINNRYNNISVDGLSQGDPFGLNSNGMPYTGSPISVDTIEAYDIKISDYDVSTDTVGATVNAVTKSGTNEFHGSVYYVYKDAANMVGKVDGEEYDQFDTDETRGFTLGGPLLKDKLFFFASYEDQVVSEFGGAGSADGVANGYVSIDEVNEAIAIASDLGMQPGTYGAASASDLENKRFLGKLDWNITDNHRASLTYQQTEEFRISPYDEGSRNVLLSSHFYNVDNVTKNVSAQLFSDWSTDFSTEIKLSRQKFDQVNGNPVDNPEAIVRTPGGTIYIGEDDNRHENQINTDRFTASVIGTYYTGDHVIKGGLEYMRHDVFNLYGKTLHGEYRFDSLEDFAAGNYSSYMVRRPAPGFSEADMAAALVYTQVSPFIQDTWQYNDNLSLTYGVRVNMPRAESAPPRTPGFEEAFGYPNDYRLSSPNTVVLPRFAFNYQFDTERMSQLRGGLGLFQSVPPFVWMANPYQNNGVTGLQYNSDDPSEVPFSPDPYNQPIPGGEANVPAYQVDTIDPDFKLPTVWKFSLGYDAELPWWGLVGSVDFLSLRAKDAVFYQAINIGEVQGVLKDGRQNYRCLPEGGWSGDAFGSTRFSGNNCGRNPNFDWDSTKLGNTDEGMSNSLTLALDKPMSNGWYGNLSYTYTDAEEVASDGSSQAWSSYQYVSRINPNQEIATTAGRLIENSVKLSLGWEHAFFGNYKTSVTAFYNGHDGLPYTWLVDGDLNGDSIDQDPAYIPLVNDPNVSYGDATAEQIAAFNSFIDGNDYLSAHRGQIASRNDDNYPWVNQLDLGIQQELPGFFSDNKAIVRLDIYNFLNMLNEDWGDTWGGTFSDNSRDLAALAGVNEDGTYVYDLGSPDRPTWDPLFKYDSNSTFPSRVVSRWSVLLTLRYEF